LFSLSEEHAHESNEHSHEAHRESHEHHEHHEAHHEHHAEHEHSEHKKKDNALVYIGAGIIVLIILAALVFFGGKGGGPTPTATPTPAASAVPLGSKVDVEALKVKVKNFLDAKFLATQKLSARIVNVTEKNGLFEVGVDVVKGDSKLDSTTVFVTLDGAQLILGNAVALVDVTPVPSPTPVPKSDKPDVKVFVMSMCPYGVQAEYAMIPVIKLLGDKASFDVRFIANVDANGTFTSLHKQPEVDEDLRQVCIAANQPAKYLAYLECFVKAPAEAINANDIAAYQAVNWTKMAADCLKQAQVNEANVTACMTGAQGSELLAKNIALADSLGVGSSPTIYVNGGAFDGARSSEAFKQGVCDAFKTAPSECSQTLSNATGTSNNIGCGT
jgi:protein-disulfide isomerase